MDTESESRISISFLYSKFGRIWGFHICFNWSACVNFARNAVIRCGSGWEHKHRNMSSCISRAYNAVWNAIFVSRDKSCFGINTVTQIRCAALISQKSRLYLSSVWGDGIWIRSKIKCSHAAVCTFFCWKNSTCPWIKIKLIIKKNVGIYNVIECIWIIYVLCIAECKGFVLWLGNRIGTVNHTIIIGCGEGVSVGRCYAFYVTDIFIALILLGRELNLIVCLKGLGDRSCAVRSCLGNSCNRESAVGICNKSNVSLCCGVVACVSRSGSSVWIEKNVNSVFKCLCKTAARYIALRENAVANFWIKIGCSTVNLYQSILCGSKLCFIS